MKIIRKIDLWHIILGNRSDKWMQILSKKKIYISLEKASDKINPMDISDSK